MDEEKLAKVLERIKNATSSFSMASVGGVPMDKDCPHCGTDMWDFLYHGPKQAGFKCIECGCVMNCTNDEIRYNYIGKTIKVVETKNEDWKT